MLPTRQGSLRLFRVFGIDVFLHWSWFLVAVLDVQLRGRAYDSLIWNVLEYVTLFAIVLLHEFGHALACKQVGGVANQIVLWPLGGVAYVAPPQRPGAMLWSIAAGPLVNVVLFPVFAGIWVLAGVLNWQETLPNLYTYIQTIWLINTLLLVFNLFPVYPLDGGQILRSILWFFTGRARSLLIASVIGFAGVGALALFALWARSIWIGIMVLFILVNCWRGFIQARALMAMERVPRRPGLRCPKCGAAPPVGTFWGCGRCRTMFDTFETGGICPKCSAEYDAAFCPDCGTLSPWSLWIGEKGQEI